MITNSAANINLKHVTIIKIIPLNVFELTKSHIKITFLHDL